MVSTQAYTAASKTSAFELKDTILREPGAQDVVVKMTCCGLCHTDYHMQVNDWGITNYPLVPGHEGVGVVVRRGEGVKGLNVGDKVGIGWISGSCEGCDRCLKGEENICTQGYSGTYLGNNNLGGCFAKEQVVHSRFAYRVPAGLPDAIVAPLLCAGITVYSPLRKWVQPNMTVGIISVGGLGHLAIQFAKALGAAVTVFSTSDRKKAEAKGFGASRFVVSKNAEEMKAAAGTCDLILNCCPFPLELEPYVSCLKADGTIVFLGIPETGGKEIKVDLYSLIFGQKTFAGSIVGGSRYMTEMFEFALKHHILPWVKCVPFDTVNGTMKALLAGETPGFYRFVLCWADANELQREVDSFKSDSFGSDWRS